MAIESLNLTEVASSDTPANPTLGPVALAVTMIRASSVLFGDEILQAHT